MFPFVSRKLLNWYDPEKRDLPWKDTKDPYTIWLSEIILQQTRVEQGLPYYLKFIEAFPTVSDLAGATQEMVLKLWEGLGYYSRARNLHFAAQQVINDFEGIFPSSYDDVIKLKGVGVYTASAISSFSSNEKRAVVDGNVYRVLSRLFGIPTPIDSTKGRKEFQELANHLIEKTDRVDLYNQAIMDFGSIVCTPRNPFCETCIFQADCKAYNRDIVYDFPVKEKSIQKKNRYLYYLVIRNQDLTYVKKRNNQDIWSGMYEFPLIERSEPLNDVDLSTSLFEGFYECDLEVLSYVKSPKHILTHQNLFISYILCNTTKGKPDHSLDILEYPIHGLEELPFSKPLRSFILEHLLPL